MLEKIEAVLKTVAVISGAESFCKKFKTIKCGNIVVDDVRYVRVADEYHCCGYQFDSYEVSGSPEKHGIDVVNCINAIRLRIK